MIYMKLLKLFSKRIQVYFYLTTLIYIFYLSIFNVQILINIFNEIWNIRFHLLSTIDIISDSNDIFQNLQ